MTPSWIGARGRIVIAFGFAIGALFLAKGIYRGLEFTHGDFYFSLPGEYAQRLNPTLWNSPDVQPAVNFNHGTYLYGPTQYLTLFPIVFLDSYRSIALALLVIYPVVLIAAWYVLNKVLSTGEPRSEVMPAVLFAMMFAFLPVTQVLIQREFEVVALLLLLTACLLFVRGREMGSGAALAALTWFKYWPLALLGAFIVQRRFKGLAAFVAATGALLLATHLVFGLERFVPLKIAGIITGLMRPLGSGEVLYPVIPRGAQKSDFCRQWVPGRGTEAEVRWMLCGLEDRYPVLSAKAIFAVTIVASASLFLWSAIALERRPADPMTVKWRAIWECSVLTIVGSAFLHAHYYYFVVFVLPLGALLWWYIAQPQKWRRTKMALWAAAYVLLNALILPTSWLSSIFHTDVWAFYLDSGLCLAGTLLLLGLVLWELTVMASATPAIETV